MQHHSAPGARLLSAVPYVPRGARAADIGTDHAYLPIHLIREGILKRALACDINRGPIESARANIRAAGLEGQIETMQTDGLCGVRAFGPDCVMIFGMGGELILRILSEAPWLREDGVRLILQPMSRVHLLRKWLLENGFSITGETLTREENRYYQTFAAEPSDAVTVYSEEELLLGRQNIEAPPPLFEGFLRHEIGVYQAILTGKERSRAADAREERRILKLLNERLEKLI